MTETLFDKDGFYKKELFQNTKNIFVFGSNLAGKHGAGAAQFAYLKCGGVYGKGVGIQGNSYAIPTKDESITTLSLRRIQNFVTEFFYFVEENPNLYFYLSAIGCGLAGYTPEQIAPLFKDAVELENVYLPQEFWDVLLKNK